MWSSPDVVGLFSNNVVSFSIIVVLSALSFSANVVRDERCFRARAFYVSQAATGNQVESALRFFDAKRCEVWHGDISRCR